MLDKETDLKFKTETINDVSQPKAGFHNRLSHGSHTTTPLKNVQFKQQWLKQTHILIKFLFTFSEDAPQKHISIIIYCELFPQI